MADHVEAAAPTDDEAPAAEAKRAGEYVLFMAPHVYIWEHGASEGEAERTEETFLFFISPTPDGRPSSPQIDEVREHGLRVIAPDRRYRVSEEHLPLLLEWLKENAVAEEPRPKTVEIDARGLDITHVLQAVSRSTGAIIVLRKGVEGPLTLKANLPADPEVLLDAICATKGLQWRRGDSGVYTVSMRPKPGTSPTDAPEPADDALNAVTRVVNLQFLDATYVAWLLGQAELPEDAFFLPPASLGIGEQTFEDAATGGGGMAEGPWKDMLPEGIESLVPVAPGSQQLVVTGTPEEAIDELRELIALIDRKPQQLIMEMFGYRGLPVGAEESDFFEGESKHEGAVRGPFLGFVPDATPSTEAPCRAERVASMNLVPAVTTAGTNRLLLAITPRINGDGTITLHAEIRKSDRRVVTADGFDEAAASAARSLASAVVNVKDGEAAGFASHCSGSWHTLIVIPRIVRETEED
jgi:hypothetical protein